MDNSMENMTQMVGKYTLIKFSFSESALVDSSVGTGFISNLNRVFALDIVE
jgi:hypothetical protein